MIKKFMQRRSTDQLKQYTPQLCSPSTSKIPSETKYDRFVEMILRENVPLSGFMEDQDVEELDIFSFKYQSTFKKYGLYAYEGPVSERKFILAAVQKGRIDILMWYFENLATLYETEDPISRLYVLANFLSLFRFPLSGKLEDVVDSGLIHITSSWSGTSSVNCIFDDEYNQKMREKMRPKFPFFDDEMFNNWFKFYSGNDRNKPSVQFWKLLSMEEVAYLYKQNLMAAWIVSLQNSCGWNKTIEFTEMEWLLYKDTRQLAADILFEMSYKSPSEIDVLFSEGRAYFTALKDKFSDENYFTEFEIKMKTKSIFAYTSSSWTLFPGVWNSIIFKGYSNLYLESFIGVAKDNLDHSKFLELMDKALLTSAMIGIVNVKIQLPARGRANFFSNFMLQY
jgi:hypothetical protein